MPNVYSYSNKTVFFKKPYKEIKSYKPLTSTSKQVKLFPLTLKKENYSNSIEFWYYNHSREIDYIFKLLMSFYKCHKIYFNDTVDNMHKEFILLMYNEYTNSL